MNPNWELLSTRNSNKNFHVQSNKWIRPKTGMEDIRTDIMKNKRVVQHKLKMGKNRWTKKIIKQKPTV